MGRCNDCEALVGAKSVTEPHTELTFLGKHYYRSDGTQSAHAERYRCKTCATPWMRDMGDRAGGGIWKPAAL